MKLFYTFWSKGHSPHDTNRVFMDLFDRSVRSVALTNPGGEIVVRTDAAGAEQLTPFIHTHADVQEVLGVYDTYDTKQWALVKVKALLDILEEEPEHMLHIDHDIVWGYDLDAVKLALDEQKLQLAYQFPEPRTWRGYINFEQHMPELARQYLNHNARPHNAGVVFWRKALLPHLRCIAEAYERGQDCSIPYGHLGLEQLMIPEIMARKYTIGSMFGLRKHLMALPVPCGADTLPQQPTMGETGGYIPELGLYHFLGGIKNEPHLLQTVDRVLGHLIYA